MLLLIIAPVIFGLANIATYQMLKAPSPGYDVHNQTTLSFNFVHPQGPIVKTQLNRDSCSFSWPIQRHSHYPVTTLNDVAAIVMYILAVPAKQTPKTTCAMLLPIQRYDMTPVTNLNDVAPVIALYYAGTNHSVGDGLVKVNMDSNSFDRSLHLDMFKKHWLFLSFISLVISIIACMYCRWKCARYLALVENRVTLNRQRREIKRLKQLDEASTKVGEQAEVIRVLQLLLGESREKEQKIAIVMKQLEEANLAHCVTIDNIHYQNKELIAVNEGLKSWVAYMVGLEIPAESSGSTSAHASCSTNTFFPSPATFDLATTPFQCSSVCDLPMLAYMKENGVPLDIDTIRSPAALLSRFPAITSSTNVWEGPRNSTTADVYCNTSTGVPSLDSGNHERPDNQEHGDDHGVGIWEVVTPRKKWDHGKLLQPPSTL